MIIGIDNRKITKNKTGVSYMIDNIFSELFFIDKKNRYKILGDLIGLGGKNISNINLPVFFQKLINFSWRLFYFPPLNFLIGKTHIFFFTNFFVFPVIARKKILMIPDLSFLKYPEFTQKKNLSFLRSKVGPSIKRSNHILTISENAKNEIIEKYGVSEEKITVIYLGCPKNIKKIKDEKEIEKIKIKYGVKGNYFLFVGTLEPRKNIEGLIRAYNMLDEKIKDDFRLVISGGKGWYYDKIFKIVEELGLNDKVVFTGYVDEEDISYIYSGASVFIFPSFYEGFGLTILEAFMAGVPVVVSNNSSLPEVGGDAVVYCQADDIDSIKKGIEKIVNNKDFGDILIRRGYSQLKKFSWKNSAEKILEIINN